MVPNPLPASIAVPVSSPITLTLTLTVSVSPSLALAFALSFALLLPLSFLFTLFFPLRLSFSSLDFALLLLGALFSLGDFSALANDFFFHGLQVGILLVTLSPSRTDLDRVLLICLCAVDAFFFRSLFANLCLSKFANLLFNCADVDQTFEEGFSFSVDASPVQRTVDKGDSFAAVECQQLRWISFDFLLGDLKHRLRDLLSLITRLERFPDLFARRVIASLLLKGVGKSIDGCASRRSEGQFGRFELAGMGDGRSIGHLYVAFCMLVAHSRCDVRDSCCHRGRCQCGNLPSRT